MIVTLSKGVQADVLAIVDLVGAGKYGGNVFGQLTWSRGRRVRFTLATRDAWKHGSRRAASGRHMRKASWEAHRDVMAAIFARDANARIQTALAIYRGISDFESRFPATAHKNCGSQMCPVTIRECTI